MTSCGADILASEVAKTSAAYPTPTGHFLTKIVEITERNRISPVFVEVS